MISCQKKDEIKSLQKKINELEISLNAKKDSISKIKLQSNELKIKSKKFEQLIEFSLDNKSIFEHIMYRIENPNPYDSEDTQRNFHNSVDEGFSIPDKKYILNDFSNINKDSYSRYILSRFDRSSGNIKVFFNIKMKNLIFSYFKKENKFYKNSGLNLYIKSLLLSYEESLNQKDNFKELFEISKKYDTSLESGEHIIFANTMATKKIKELFKQENLTSTNEEIYHEWERFVFYVYSFWARRINENNDQIIYKLLKEFDEKTE